MGVNDHLLLCVVVFDPHLVILLARYQCYYCSNSIPGLAKVWNSLLYDAVNWNFT